jgi:hypothetical protein
MVVGVGADPVAGAVAVAEAAAAILVAAAGDAVV